MSIIIFIYLEGNVNHVNCGIGIDYITLFDFLIKYGKMKTKVELQLKLRTKRKLEFPCNFLFKKNKTKQYSNILTINI